MDVIDLRSDTVTRPSKGMRQAMADADVGDDVFGEDPTVNRLEERIADFLGHESALFVPSGTMANQLALKVHCQPGDDVIVGDGNHVQHYESGAAAAIAGVQLTAVGHGGLFTAHDVEAAIKPEGYVYPPTRLICVENTHNRSGGRIFPARALDEIVALGRKRGLGLHLDGARLWHVAAAQGTPLRDLAAVFDTVTLCFSKGLGAPVGSVLLCSRDLRTRAHRFRKMLGGGLRQSGVLAAAALWALDHNVDRLSEDHANATRLRDGLANIAGLEPQAVQTNIVMVDLSTRLPTAAALAAALKMQGVLVLPFGARRLRLVTHLDVDRAACEKAVAVMAQVVDQSR